MKNKKWTKNISDMIEEVSETAQNCIDDGEVYDILSSFIETYCKQKDFKKYLKENITVSEDMDE